MVPGARRRDAWSVAASAQWQGTSVFVRESDSSLTLDAVNKSLHTLQSAAKTQTKSHHDSCRLLL